MFQLRFCELEQLEQIALFQEKTLINEHEIEFQNWNKSSQRYSALIDINDDRQNGTSPCRTPSVRSPASDRRPQGGHPCIERMRDAQGRSNALRPLQRRFKARKKPEGYTSTTTGLKRLKTQKYGVSWQRERKGDAIRRPPTYTQAQTHSCKRRVRRFLFWWRRGESNSGPRKPPDWHLQAQSLV